MTRGQIAMLAGLVAALTAGAGAWAAPVAVALDRLAGRLEVLAREPDIAGLAVVAASPEEILFQATWGLREVGTGTPVDGDTRFRIASLSKGFASTVAGLLVSEGTLAWDDPVVGDVDYFTLPLPSEARRTTVEHLLSHRTGLPHNAFDLLLEANWQPERIVRRYAEVEPMCAVGTCYGYQNITYNLLAPIVEARTRHAFEGEVASRLFAPLAMRSAGFGRPHLTADDNHARPHVRTAGRQLVPRPIRPHYYRVPASAGINLSVTDLGTWLRAQLGAFPAVVPPTLLDELRRPRVFTQRELRYGWRRDRLAGAWYGLGWRIYDYAGHTVVYHAGAVEGYRAQIAVFPAERVALAALWNSSANGPWGIVPEFADALFDLAAEDWMKLELVATAGTAASLAAPR